MSLSRPFVPALTAALIAACASDPPRSAEPCDDARIAASVKAALGPGDWDARYFDARVDLNGDERQEVLTLVAGPMVCGTGGCTLFVFTPQADAYRLVAQLSVVRTPVRVSSHEANGWRNLVVGIGGGGLPAGNAELAFDGTTYPSNPTVEPARRVSDLSGSEIVIPQFESYREGKPLSADGFKCRASREITDAEGC